MLYAPWVHWDKLFNLFSGNNFRSWLKTLVSNCYRISKDKLSELYEDQIRMMYQVSYEMDLLIGATDKNSGSSDFYTDKDDSGSVSCNDAKEDCYIEADVYDSAETSSETGSCPKPEVFEEESSHDLPCSGAWANLPSNVL